MAKLSTKHIQNVARELIASSPGGIRYSTLVEKISQHSPETPENTIRGSVWNLDAQFPDEIAKPSRGLYTSLTSPESPSSDLGVTEQVGTTGNKVKESDFYKPFAQWLINDLDEATQAESLGGSISKSKWGTPDVIGIYKPMADDLIKFPIEIISVELKIDPQAPVTAFGQAIAYRLFSSKTYIAMPTSIGEDDSSRLESLCMLFGVGLVLFDLNVDSPQFDIRVRAQRFLPDMFYVNEFAHRLKQANRDLFNRLF